MPAPCRTSSTSPWQLALTGLACACLLPLTDAAAQTLTHVGQDAYTNTQQTVQLLDAWQDATSDAFFAAEPQDVLVTVRSKADAIVREDVELLLHGPWGWFHLSYPLEALEITDDVTQHRATERVQVDIDGDGENEIVLIERRLEARRQLDPNGFALTDAPLLSSYSVDVRYLDRSEDSLLQHSVPPDPLDPGFALLLQAELGGTVHAGLQLAAASYEFDQEEYAKARYRLLTVKEWAERALPARARDSLSVDMELYQPSVEDPSVAWIMALRKHSSLPPYYRRHR